MRTVLTALPVFIRAIVVPRAALDHFIFLGVGHVRQVWSEFVRHDNGGRPSPAIHGILAPCPERLDPPPQDGKLVALPAVGGSSHDYRLAA